MTLFIKYMVSTRCKMLVKEELKKLGLHYVVVDLGVVDIMEDISAEETALLKKALLIAGLELMDDKRAVLIEQIKRLISASIYQPDGLAGINFPEFLAEKLHHNYTCLAVLFSEVQGTTIEQFIIGLKIERIKELMIYGDLTITEIAWKMNYSSVAHLSNQFKKMTGLTPTHFRQLKDKRRTTGEDINQSIT